MVPTTSPEFIRLPKQRCPFTGLSRSTINRLILPNEENGNQPPVRSHVLRKRGRGKGVRLIDYASLVSFLRSQPSTIEEVVS